MAKGNKTGGGSRKGIPNRSTAEVQEKLAALGCDPIEGMARIAMDKKNSPELRGRMLAELAAYRYPKLKAMEFPLTAGEQGSVNLVDLLALLRRV